MITNLSTGFVTDQRMGRSNIDSVRTRIMNLELAPVFDDLAWQCVLADLRAAGRVSALVDAVRRMGTAKANSVAVETEVV